MNYLASPTKILILRGDDPTGHGYYGAKRSWKADGKHHGLDIVTVPGEPIYATNKGKARIGQVYADHKEGKELMQLIEVTGPEYKVKLMYVEPCISQGSYVNQGELIGFAQNISAYHNSKDMINHIHAQVFKNGLETDPEPIIKII